MGVMVDMIVKFSSGQFVMKTAESYNNNTKL